MDGSRIKQEILQSLVIDKMVHDSVGSDLTDSGPSCSGTNAEDATELKPEGSMNNSAQLRINEEIQNGRMWKDSNEPSSTMVSNLIVVAPQVDNFGKCELFRTNRRPYSPDHQEDINQDTKIPAVVQEMMDHQEGINQDTIIPTVIQEKMGVVIKEEITEDVSEEEIDDQQIRGEIQNCEEHIKLEDDINCPWVDNLTETVKPEAQPAVVKNKISDDRLQELLIVSESILEENTQPQPHAPDLPELLQEEMGIILTDTGVWSTRFLPEGTEFGPYDHKAVPSDSFAEGRDWTSLLRKSTVDTVHNMIAEQVGSKVFYKLVTDIQPQTELILLELQPTNNIDERDTDSATTCQEPDTSVTTKQKDSGTKLYECMECGNTFKQKANLKRHMLIHSGEKPHECMECGKKYILKHHLMEHMRTHSGEKPYECEQCGKYFTRSRSLKQHLETHTQKKPFKCMECGKAFGLKGGLMRHMLTHSGEKPHQCIACGNKYALKHHLVKHMLTHSDVKPHECKQCGKFFSLPGYLKQHMKSHTRGKP